MKANKLSAMLVSELFEKKVIDESAQTMREIAAATGKSPAQADRLVRAKMEDGIVERVWKRSNRQLVPAYRIKK